MALPLILQAITGLIMAAEPFAAALQGPTGIAADASLTAPDDLRDVDVAQILTAAHAAVAGDLVPRRYRPQPHGLVVVDFAAAGRQPVIAQVLLDAASLRVQAVRQTPDRFYRWIHALHENLLSGPLGRGVIGWIGVGLLCLALSGVVLWWPAPGRLKAALTVTPGATGWLLQRQVHGATGIWVLGMLLLQSMSGIALSFPQTARAVAGLPAPIQAGRAGRASDVMLDADRLVVDGVATAQATLPDAVLQDMRLPAGPGRPMTALMQPRGRWQGAPGAMVFIDPATAGVMSVQQPATQSTGASLLDWLRALHYGSGLGVGWRLAICLSGLALPVFPITGVAMWLLRRRIRRRNAARRGSAMTWAGE